jgi:hypothetical protein
MREKFEICFSTLESILFPGYDWAGWKLGTFSFFVEDLSQYSSATF